MSMITKMLRRDAIYFPPGHVGSNGRRSTGAPQSRRCRWEQKVSQTIKQDGTFGQSTVRVFVNEDVAVGGYLALGLLDPDNPPASPLDVGGLEIMAFNKVPNLKNTEYLRTAFL